MYDFFERINTIPQTIIIPNDRISPVALDRDILRWLGHIVIRPVGLLFTKAVPLWPILLINTH